MPNDLIEALELFQFFNVVPEGVLVVLIVQKVNAEELPTDLSE